MEQHLVDLVRQPWVILLKLLDEGTCDVVAKHWLNKRTARCREFQQHTGINLTQFIGYYIEAGGESAPTSPILPAKVSPVLLLRRDKTNHVYSPIVTEVNGFFHETLNLAWVRTSRWEEMLGDQDYLEKNFPKVEKQSNRGRQQVIKHAADLMAKRADLKDKWGA
jgi:hypothetical protein